MTFSRFARHFVRPVAHGLVSETETPSISRSSRPLSRHGVRCLIEREVRTGSSDAGDSPDPRLLHPLQGNDPYRGRYGWSRLEGMGRGSGDYVRPSDWRRT